MSDANTTYDASFPIHKSTADASTLVSGASGVSAGIPSPSAMVVQFGIKKFTANEKHTQHCEKSSVFFK